MSTERSRLISSASLELSGRGESSPRPKCFANLIPYTYVIITIGKIVKMWFRRNKEEKEGRKKGLIDLASFGVTAWAARVLKRGFPVISFFG